MGSGRSVLVTVLLSLLVAAGAVGTSAYLKTRGNAAASAPPTSTTPAQASTTCRAEPCQVLAAATLGSTKIELIADAGGQSARLRIGEDRLVESTIPSRGAVLTAKSLHCVVGTLSACMIKGDYEGGLIGEVIVGRSGKWNATVPRYLSNAGYLSLINVVGDGAPEVVAVQRGYFAQVFALDGVDLGCTPMVSRPDKLSGWPDQVKPAESVLKKPCP